MNPPAFQFYPDDFMAGTIFMTDEEVGIYMRLLCLQWSKGSVGDLDMERACSRSPNALAQVKAKFDVGPDGRWRNKRMEIERQIQADYREEQRRKGVKSGVSRRTAAEQRLNRCSTEAEPEGEPNANRTRTEREPEGNRTRTLLSPVSGSQSPVPTPPYPPAPAAPPPVCVDSPKQTSRNGFVAPSVIDVRIKCVEIGLPPKEADAFVDYYTSNGWRVGKNPMKEWEGALRNWKRKREEGVFVQKPAAYHHKPTTQSGNL